MIVDARASGYHRLPGPPIAREDWMGAGSCVGAADPELWFPPRKTGGRPWMRRKDAAQAISVCMTCPVRQDCGNFAIGEPALVGVWGAMTDDDRETIRRRRAA